METMYPQYQSPSLSPTSNLFRLLFTGVLGFYAASHVIFAPIEFVGILYCADPLLIKYLIIVLGVIILKYLIFIGLFCSAYSEKSMNALIPVVYLIGMGALCFGAIMIYKEAEAIGLGNLINSPYVFDFLGLSICGFCGVIYMLFSLCLSEQPKYMGYSMVPYAKSIMMRPNIIP